RRDQSADRGGLQRRQRWKPARPDAQDRARHHREHHQGSPGRPSPCRAAARYRPVEPVSEAGRIRTIVSGQTNRQLPMRYRLEEGVSAMKTRTRSFGSSVLLVAGLVAALMLILAGCATAPPPVEETKLVWPPPPLAPRIKFVRSIVSDADLKADTTFSQGLAA